MKRTILTVIARRARDYCGAGAAGDSGQPDAAARFARHCDTDAVSTDYADHFAQVRRRQWQPAAGAD